MRELQTQLARVGIVIERLVFCGKINQTIRVWFRRKQEPKVQVKIEERQRERVTYSDHSGCIDSDCLAEAAPVSREYIHLETPLALITSHGAIYLTRVPASDKIAIPR